MLKRHDMDDRLLLHEYAEKGSEKAFAEIVHRYAGMVYSVCMRELSDPGHAAEASQAAFFSLSRYAKKIRSRTVSGWLMKTAKYTSINLLKREKIRKKYEKKAAEMKQGQEYRTAEWKEVMPVLNNGLVGLSEKDRSAVILRYFQEKSFIDIGNTLGVSEKAAHMRVKRAVEKLRRFFSKKGIILPAAALSGMLSMHAVQAAPASVTEGCMSVAQGPVPESVAHISNGALKMIVLGKVKAVAIALGCAAVVTAAASVAVIHAVRESDPGEKPVHENPAPEADYPDAENLPVIRELPDPFLMQNGNRVSTPADWDKRREEIKDMLQHYQFGRMPPPPGNITAEIKGVYDAYAGGRRTFRKIYLSMGPEKRIVLPLSIVMPEGKGPFPVIIRNNSGSVGFPGSFYREAVRRGYMVVTYDRGDWHGKKGVTHIIQAAYPDYDWGTIAVIAWQGMRVIDYLLTLDSVDGNRIVVAGRGHEGRAVLLHSAFDERVALTVLIRSMGLVVESFRARGKRGLKLSGLIRSYPHYFNQNLGKFTKRTVRLPFDKHFLFTLISPRPIFMMDVMPNNPAGLKGVHQVRLAAGEVYTWMGAEHNIRFLLRDKSEKKRKEDDWPTLLDIADHIFFGRKVENIERFESPSFRNIKPGFSWRAPNSH